MLKDGWLSRDGVLYEATCGTHSLEALNICGGDKNNIDAEKMLEENGWVRIRHGIPFYSSLISPTDIQKKIVVEAYYAELEHYRNMCARGAALMFSCFFECEYYEKLKGGML